MVSKDPITLRVQTRSGEWEDITLTFEHSTLMHALYDADLGVEASCGGCASCATCHVLIDESWVDRLPPRRAEENILLKFQEHFDDRRSRLSCQIDASPELGGLVLTVAPEE